MMFGHKLIICATLLLMSSSALSQASVSLKNAVFPTESPLPPSSPPTSRSSPRRTSTTTTLKPTESTASTTTTPVQPTTSTVAPMTSTVAPTTSTVAPTTSTAAPTTTTPAPISTTTPKPNPTPSTGSWNCSCIMINMAAQFNFTYETKSGNTSHGQYNLPSSAVVDHCLCESIATQSMQLNWGLTKHQDSLVLQFEKRNQSVALTQMQFYMFLSTEEFPDAKENQTIQLYHVSRNTDFKAPEKMSYHCTRVEKFNMSETVNGTTVGDVSVSHVQVEAFRDAKTTGFSAVHDCDSSATSDVVPIAVGIALAALIMVVLISYLCARRRSTSRGYMSF